jgi:hypothetical protein
MSISWPDIDPQDVLDYVFDWTKMINDPADGLSSTTAVVSSGTVTIDSHAVIAGTQKTVTWLSDAQVGDINIVLHVVTNMGREIDQTMLVRCAQR